MVVTESPPTINPLFDESRPLDVRVDELARRLAEPLKAKKNAELTYDKPDLWQLPAALKAGLGRMNDLEYMLSCYFDLEIVVKKWGGNRGDWVHGTLNRLVDKFESDLPKLTRDSSVHDVCKTAILLGVELVVEAE